MKDFIDSVPMFLIAASLFISYFVLKYNLWQYCY